MDNVLNEIKLIIEDIADVSGDDIKADSSMIEDLDLTSLEIMGIVAEIESRFSIKLSEEEMLGISTVEELVEMIKSKKQ